MDTRSLNLLRLLHRGPTLLLRFFTLFFLMENAKGKVGTSDVGRNRIAKNYGGKDLLLMSSEIPNTNK